MLFFFFLVPYSVGEQVSLADVKCNLMCCERCTNGNNLSNMLIAEYLQEYVFKKMFCSFML